MPSISAMTIDRAARHSLTACQARRSGLRKNSIAIFMMLLVEYGLGMGVNLYARVPAADHGARVVTALGRALTSQPVLLAIHATLGLLILVAGVSVLTRAVLARDLRAIAALAAGLGAIIAAAISGATFVSNQQAGASMAMAILTGVALLSYLATMLMAAGPTVEIPGGPGE
jgi:hypothetical protein